VPWFRRRPLHERLAAAGEVEPVEWNRAYEPLSLASFDPVVIHGQARRREWDAVVTAEAPGVRDDRVRFVALAEGDLLVEEGDESADLGPLADAVDAELEAPYRAQAVRQQRDVFAVGARRTELVELPAADGEHLMLTVQDGARELEVDGERIFGGQPALERIGERAGPDYVVRAQRLDGPIFEVEVATL